MSGPTLLGGYGGGILNAGASILENGRRAFSGNGIGMSANSRALLEGFYNNATALFNQLYTKAENAEVMNTTTILALRNKYAYLATDEIKESMVAKSTTTGTQVDTEA